MTRQNFGERDSRVRCQTYSPVRRLPGLPHELFANYWRDVHGPLCTRLPGLGFYVQHHFSRDMRANLWPAIPRVRTIDIVLDGAVEIGFKDDEDLKRFVEASPILFGDEINIFEWDAAFFLPNGSRTFIDAQEDGTPNGPDKLHRLHIYLHGAMDETFRTWLDDFAKTLAADEAVWKLRLHVPEPFDNDNPQPPSPVAHQVPDDMITMAILEIGFATALSARVFYDSPTFKSTIAGQSTHVEAMAVFLVTGVYTYVRDSVPTTAGLRGSRTAEIIEQIGATNHLDIGVTRLFTASHG
ncbi:hypothetical protein BH10PSE17_BH10PSE17_26230 [soil metagenome]